MELQYLGHSAFRIETKEGKQILIDPFLERNPLAPLSPKQLKADYIILTHAHGDHLGDALTIAHMANTTIICVSELASIISKRGYKVHAMQIGGSFKFEFGKVKLTIALHGSATPDGLYAGLAAGVIIEVDGLCLYHCGDTGLFGDMQLIGDMHSIDYLLIPIGGNYTMDIDDAVRAVKMLRPKLAIPMHYNTFPVITVNPEEFVSKVEAAGFEALIMKPGDSF